MNFARMEGQLIDQVTTEDPSLNSSYADVFEASGVVIRDYTGSYSKGPLVHNDVTYNLNKCKSNVVVPYFKLLSLIGWRRFDCCSYWCSNVWNLFYTMLVFSVLIFWYVIRVLTCNGRLVVMSAEPKQIIPATTVNPNTTWQNLTMLRNASNIIPHHDNTTLFTNPCNHIFGTYIVPNFLHFFAFLIGFYHFRIKEHEGLYVLMEKVYLQSRYPRKLTRTLRSFTLIGSIWLLVCFGSMIHYFFAFEFVRATGIPNSRPYLMYTTATLITISNLFANCVNLAVTLSFCGQCELLKHYIDGVAERVEEKSTSLKTAMKELLDIQSHFKRMNGSLSYSMSLLAFDATIVVVLNIILLFNFKEMSENVWVYRFVSGFGGTIYLAFVLIQAALVTARPKKLLEKALSIRVFGYQSHTEADIDSFLNFTQRIDLQAELFTIPMKSQYLWGVMFIAVQVLILLVQTGGVINRNSKWL